MTRLRAQDGFTLVELLVAMTLMIVVMFATLDVFDAFGRTNQRNVTLNDMQENARLTLDRVSRDLRNAAAPPGQPSAVEWAQPFDLVFDSIDAKDGGTAPESTVRVRYCLDSTGKLWRQTMPWATGFSAPTACPQTAFGTAQLVTQGVVNQSLGGSPPVFSYDAADPVQMTSIGADLYVDTDINTPPAAAHLDTSVRLRNHNRPPVAAFTALPQGNRHVLLDAGPSSDPDGQALKITWYCDGAVCPNYVTGQVVDYQEPPPSGAPHTFAVQVTDTGGLSNTSPTQTVNVP